MEKMGNRGPGRTPVRPPVRSTARLGGAVISGLLTAMIAADASATQMLDTPVAEHLTQAVAAIEKGNGQSAVSGLQSMTEAGDAEAGYLLGSIWHKGLGVRRDFAKARDAYAASAFLGNPKAMNELGLLYRDGLGVVADPIEAVAWFRVASEYNLAAAMTNRDALEAELKDRDRAAGRALALRRELEIDLVSRDKLGEPPKVPVRVARNAGTRDIALAMLRQETDVRNSGPVKPAAAEEPAATATTTAASPTGKTAADPEHPFLVQIGVFAKPESVQRIRKEAEGLGLTVQETARRVDGKTATRLTVGPFPTEVAAQEAAAKLDAALKVTTKVMSAAS